MIAALGKHKEECLQEIAALSVSLGDVVDKLLDMKKALENENTALTISSAHYLSTTLRTFRLRVEELPDAKQAGVITWESKEPVLTHPAKS
jgi:hypothetical protein